MLKSDLCDCSDAYIVVNGGVTVTEPDNQKKKKKKKKKKSVAFTFKNNAPFINCISKMKLNLLFR